MCFSQLSGFLLWLFNFLAFLKLQIASYDHALNLHLLIFTHIRTYSELVCWVSLLFVANSHLSVTNLNVIVLTLSNDIVSYPDVPSFQLRFSTQGQRL